MAAVVKTVVEYVFRLQHGHWFNTGFEAVQTPMHCALSSEVVPGAYYSQTPAAYLGKGWIEGEWPMEVPNATINDPAAPAKLWALTWDGSVHVFITVRTDLCGRSRRDRLVPGLQPCERRGGRPCVVW